MRRKAIPVLIGVFVLAACAAHPAASPPTSTFAATPAATTRPTAAPTPSPSATFAATSLPLQTPGPLTADTVFGVPLPPTGFHWDPELPEIIGIALASLSAEESARVTARSINWNVFHAAVVVVSASTPDHAIPPEGLLAQITGVPPDEIQLTIIDGRSVLLASNPSFEAFETGVSWSDQNLVIVLLTDSPGSAETFIMILDQAMN